MRNKSSPEITLFFLLMATLCLDALKIKKILFFPARGMTWTEARQYCQKRHIDMITLRKMNRSFLAATLTRMNVKEVWIGLHRDPENGSVWRWINLQPGEGISVDNASLSSMWADGEQRQCAFVSIKDQMWDHGRCSSKRPFYCSVGDKLEYHENALSWYNASHFCKNKSSNLATVTKTNTDKLSKSGWIGLYQEGGETWHWIGNLSSDYRNWVPQRPLTQDCASFDAATEKVNSNECSEKLPPVCSDDSLVLVKENKTWEEAVSHCLNMEITCSDIDGSCTYHYKLLILPDYNYVRGRMYGATTDEIWTGLRFLGWKWMWLNGEKPEDQGMLPECPPQRKHCGTLSKYDTNEWIIRDCSERRNFICYKHW